MSHISAHHLAHQPGVVIDSDPQQVRGKLEALGDLYQITDITIVTICYGFAGRVRSYELVADICGLRDTAQSAPPSIPAESPA